ncbi:MAG TPA: bifunctional serine/threonine-protein kinase/formylglycine-generating enzyme family protein [Planctomycetota bacterium]|nr:bifunctional serine/threonine-protein kinase/formylglycine-generating enzyme family protein [Planctomycetota bacterium]
MTVIVRNEMDLAQLKLALAHELTIVEKLGEGGEGEVFLARTQPGEDAQARGTEPRKVALKLLREGRTAPLLARALELAHPHIVPVLGTGSVLGRTYVLMEYFPGLSLRSRMAGKPLPEEDLRVVFVALASALEHAHARGVVHQDVKPENVLVTEDASGLTVKLADFGLAVELADKEKQALVASRTLRSAAPEELRTLAGTLPYIAPERLEDRAPAPSPRTDVYSLGVLLFEALTGKTPGGLELPSELRPSLDPRWDAAIKRALARDPGRRFESVATFRAQVLPLFTPAKSPSSARIAIPTEMVLIPPGTFRMGEPRDADARPARTVTLPAFEVDRTPVTNAQYHAYVLATGAKAPAAWGKKIPKRLPSALALLPVTGVTWDEASAYAKWAGKRLPTEAEWERVARGRSGRAYPYGDHLDTKKIHADEKTLESVLAHPDGASDEGVLDLTGNAWEWCADWFGPYEAAQAISPLGPPKGEARVLRGGYDPSRPGSGSAWFRRFLRADVRNPRVGFRCVRSLPLA